MASEWTMDAFKSRISNYDKRERFEAGSPNSQEIAAYAQHISQHFQGACQGKIGVVLGLTPELRVMLHRLGMTVVCVDKSQEAIAVFRDWLPSDVTVNETIIESDWLNLLDVLQQPVNVIVGDGVFGNLLSLNDHRLLLKGVADSLKEDGICVFRKILIPQNFPVEHYEASTLIQRHGVGELDDTEFGFAMRIWGMRSIAFDDKTFLLDNRVSFETFRQMYKDKLLTDTQIAAIERYYFGGLNLIPPQHIWETLLQETGFTFQSTPLKGKDWYDFYRIYGCLHH